MSWMLCRSVSISRIIRTTQNSLLARTYHSRDGVYGCKPYQETDPFKLQLPVQENRIKESALYQLVTAYRQHGHRKAQLDPLGILQQSSVPELDAGMYGLGKSSDRIHTLSGILSSGRDTATTAEVLQYLEDCYCGPLSAEFQHLASLEEREWFAEKFEQIQQEDLNSEKKVALSKLMLKSQAFDNFLASKFTTVKRYGGEGAESAMAFYDELFRLAAQPQTNIDDVILCIAHRGRLNLLACLMKYPSVVMFRKMKGKSEFPPDVDALGDVLSHLTSSVDLDYDGNTVHATMLPNPSHLEAVNPVAMGKTRARQQSRGKADYSPDGSTSQPGDGALCFMIHGDASFSAQGVVAESFAMSNVPHYDVGGTIHLIINNQIGFTTGADRGRSSHHCSDVGKMVDCPVVHVNGDHPEEVVKACRMAMAYRQRFRKDVVVDYLCYRRWGHNELDEPAFTQPIMYNVIRNRLSIPDQFANKITADKLCDKEDLNDAVASWNRELSENFSQIDAHVPKPTFLEKQWTGLVPASAYVTTWDTGVKQDVLQFVGVKSVSYPQDLKIHPTLVKSHIKRRLELMEKGSGLDWATAEALAMGSLLYQGYNVRISGQDVGRGTFSHRHVMFVDQSTEAMFIPLNHMHDKQQSFFEVCNSILSEEAVLGFEYGMSIENPQILPIWEAQFGDFFNGAQIMIDTLISGGEAKWMLQSGVVLLLPHGIDGAGPEHSSCKIERFLQLTDSSETEVDGDNVNMEVVNPTTPAQYFHLLRRQMVRNYRKPLIVVAPKGMLRHPSCVSSLADMGPLTTFSPVIGDSGVNKSGVKCVVFVSGKHYYTLDKERTTRGVTDMALIRLESLCPFPAEAIRQQLLQYPNATDYIWSQEEHRNMGAWTFINTRFQNIVGKKLRYVGREVSALPAVGIGAIHQEENKYIVDETFAMHG